MGSTEREKQCEEKLTFSSFFFFSGVTVHVLDCFYVCGGARRRDSDSKKKRGGVCGGDRRVRVGVVVVEREKQRGKRSV